MKSTMKLLPIVFVFSMILISGYMRDVSLTSDIDSYVTESLWGNNLDFLFSVNLPVGY